MMTNNYSEKNFKWAVGFWLIIAICGLIIIPIFGVITVAIGAVMFVLGLLGVYSTIWLYRERKRVNDWSDLR